MISRFVERVWFAVAHQGVGGWLLDPIYSSQVLSARDCLKSPMNLIDDRTDWIGPTDWIDVTGWTDWIAPTETDLTG